MGGTGTARGLGLALIMVGVVACAGPTTPGAPTPSPLPSNSVAPGPTSTPPLAATASPAPTPTVEPTPTEEVDATEPPPVCGAPTPYGGPYADAALLPGSAIRVTVAELNIRSEPCTAAPKLGTVKQGKLLIVIDDAYGPVKANGYAWYQVVLPQNTPNEQLPTLPQRWFPADTDTTGGWIAVTDGVASLVNPLVARCPTTVDLDNVAAMLPAEFLWCFDAPIVVEGTFGCDGCGGIGGGVDAEPAWLTDLLSYGLLQGRWGTASHSSSLLLAFKPGGPARPADGAIIRATVHVDDPAAQSCSFTWEDTPTSFVTAADHAISWCRERLVIDSYKVLGTDPNFGY